MKNRKLVLLRNFSVLILSLLFLVAGSGCVYVDQLLGKINFTAPDTQSKAKTGDLFEGGVSQSDTDSAKSGILGGLYHDDAITNILLMGTDNYEKNDVGRSDSIMLVSVDTRHNKLKITSFMRDLYLAIPGEGSNKLNAAYSLPGGGEAGAKKVVSTIEANFGIDMDRYVVINYDAFAHIIDRLGGVTITLRNDERDQFGNTEADLINKYSGDKKKVHAGVNNLSGYQARYYARIRAIGNDYERTERQRKVFVSLVDKMKKANLNTIAAVLSYSMQQVTTNMTKDEVVQMCIHSLTYLNYPVSEHRVPVDGEFDSKNVYIGKDLSAVLVPDLDKCRQSFASFIYEKDLPQKTYD